MGFRELPGLDSNQDKENQKTKESERISKPVNTSGETEPRRLCASTTKVQSAVDPDLARVVEAWPELPEVIRRAVLALVDSVR